jgi:hypothetical protein|tara:strand:+ start:1794 stop:2516 length:723 start_codon:yes stop_codon:yes gene_type:complete
MTTLKKWRQGIVDSELQPMTRLVLHTLAYYMDAESNTCVISVPEIVKATSLSRAGVFKHINLAKSFGWIFKESDSNYVAQIPDKTPVAPVKVVPKPKVIKPVKKVEPKPVVKDATPKPPEGAAIYKRISNSWKWGTSADVTVAEYIYGCLKRIDNRAKLPNMAVWANDVRLMRVNDERSPREICEVFKWANEDSFWQSNILSPSKLREKFTALRTRMYADAPIASGRLRKTAGNPTGVVL